MPEDLNNEAVNSSGQITVQRQNLEIDQPDDDLCLAIDNAIDDSQGLKQKNDNQGKVNKSYWRTGGKEQDDLIIHPRHSKARLNRIFTDVETMIPILTSEEPEGILTGIEDNNIKSQTQLATSMAWDKYKMQYHMQKLARHWLIYKVGVLKYRWDKVKGFTTENVITRKIGFDKRATSKQNCEFIWEEMEDSVENLKDKVPKAADELISQFGEKAKKTKVKYHEFWGGNGKWVVWKYDKIVLDKMENPNFDYENPENNIFDEPQFPYLLLNVFNLGDENSLYDDTGCIEVAAPTQDGINDLERLILDLNRGRKRTMIADGGVVTEKQAQSLVNDIGDDIIRVGDTKGNVAGAIQMLQPGVPDGGMFQNLGSLQAEVDNIFGIHPTAKGEQGQGHETAKGRQMIIQGDYGRIDMIVRNMEGVAEEWFNAYLQMMKVYSTQPEKFDNGEEQTLFDASIVPHGALVLVKKGSTLPTDEISKREAAMKLAQMDLIDPKTMLDELGYPNPEEMANKLYEWLLAQGKLKVMPGQQQQPQGQPGAQPGQGANPQAEQAAQRIQQMIQSRQFQQLPPDQQAAFIQKAKMTLQQVNQPNGSQPQPQPAPAVAQ